MKKILKNIFFSIVCILSFFSICSVSALEYELAWAKITANTDEKNTQKYTHLISNTFLSPWLPFSWSWLILHLDIHQVEPRGQFRGREIRLSANIADNGEFVKLLTHELAHFIDIYIFRPTQLEETDISRDFYKISWQSAKLKHSSASLKDFVSGYAATNQYEDFAESFVWYIFHNDDFFERAMKNENLRQKYLFFADNVFSKWQFQGTDFSVKKAENYLWDTTKIPIVLEKYLSFSISSI